MSQAVATGQERRRTDVVSVLGKFAPLIFLAILVVGL
mgnify:FL=1